MEYLCNKKEIPTYAKKPTSTLSTKAFTGPGLRKSRGYKIGTKRSIAEDDSDQDRQTGLSLSSSKKNKCSYSSYVGQLICINVSDDITHMDVREGKITSIKMYKKEPKFYVVFKDGSGDELTLDQCKQGVAFYTCKKSFSPE